MLLLLLMSVVAAPSGTLTMEVRSAEAPSVLRHVVPDHAADPVGTPVYTNLLGLDSR